MINLYIFSNKSRGGLYGVGTYIRELITALRSKSNSIHIHVVHILCDQLQIEKKEVKDVSYWGINGFKEFIIAGGEFSKDVPGDPIFYSASYLSDDSPFYAKFRVNIPYK